MVIDNSFEKYLLAFMLCRMQTNTARQFAIARALHKDHECPLQAILGYLSTGLSLDYADGIYAKLSTSPFIYSVMKDLYNFAPKEKLTTKAHIIMTLNVISDLLKKNSDDERVPEYFRHLNILGRLKRGIEGGDYLNGREIDAIIN